MTNPAQHLLKDIFGYDQFRTPQQDVIEDLVGGSDALVVMPTGGGKSLCYQLPALLRPGVAVVVSPLIALMHDQVAALSQLGIRAAYLNSSLDMVIQSEVEHSLISGELDLLYVAPERLNQARILALFQQLDLALFAVDEAHCVSQWGHDFRPDYLNIANFCDHFPSVPRIALTATADPRTQQEIVDRLRLNQAKIYIQGFDRPNIRYRIGQKSNAKDQLFKFLKDEHSQDAGVVYCLSRKRVDDIAEWLVERGFNALPYHAGLSSELRQHHQHRFLTEEGIIMVATIAFGMGIDKPNVRFVAHLDLPKSIEAYYQETGRAGRDGLPADAWMVFGLQDVLFLRQRLEQSEAHATFKSVERQKLEAMLGLCEVSSCRRQVLLGYFGEDLNEPCGNCDNCLESPAQWNATDPARKALSSVFRTGQRYGVNYIIDVLVGNRTDKIAAQGHDKLSTWSIGKDLKRNEWRSVFRQLITRGFLNVSPGEYGTLYLDESCRALLKGEETLLLKQDVRKQQTMSRRRAHGKLDPSDHDLWDALKALRKDLAVAQDVPPYVIFHDATLMEMVVNKPVRLEQLHNISGVGERKLEQYGQQFISVIAEQTSDAESVSHQAQESIALYRSGMTVDAVARMQKLSAKVIYNHLAHGIESGELSVADVVELPEAEIKHIQQVIVECQEKYGAALKPVFDQLGGAYELGVINCVKQGLQY